MMGNGDSPSQHDTTPTPADGASREVNMASIPQVTNFFFKDKTSQPTPLFPAENPTGSPCLQSCKGDPTFPKSHNNRESLIDIPPTQTFNTSPSGSSTYGPTQLLTDEFEASALSGERVSPDHVDGSSRITQPDLSPHSFTTLVEAFQASLHVVRSLRNALQLMQRDLHHEYRLRQQEGEYNDGALPSAPLNSLARASDIVASQMSFIAEDDAYIELIREATATSHSTNDSSATEAPPIGSGSPSGAADASTVPHSEPSLETTAAAKTVAEAHAPTAALGSPMAGELEYELSVCKALLLLQQLTPNNTTTGDDAPTPVSPSPMSPHSQTQMRYSQSTLHTTTADTNDLIGLSAYRRGVPASALLNVLLRIRMLQRTQQLLRADFVRLLHQQRKQHNQLQQAVKATVVKLEAEKNLLFGRMQRLTAIVSRK